MNHLKFEIKKRDILGRICTFDTPHGKVTTPTLLPVINPNIHLIPPKELKALFNVQMIITNSYIIRKGEKLREKALSEGIHSLVDFQGPIMTDSGTFQSYVHGDIDVDPQEIVAFQRDIGVDVGTILDVFSTPDRTFEEAKEDVARTVERARIAHEIKGDMSLATTVQGSIYPELRTHCARELSSMKGDFFPIGGVVPLLEDYRYGEIVDLVLASKKGLDISKPVHLFGAGHPMVFALAAAMGCDFFDSSSYAKYAVGGRMMFPNGTGKLDEMEYSPCSCPVCVKYAPDELREMERTESIRKLAEHNLYASFAELRRIKEKISSGTLWELVEERAGTHPKMHEGLCRLYAHGDYLEMYEPVSKKRFMTAKPGGFSRPEVARYRKRLTERYVGGEETVLVLPDGSKPYHMGHGKTIEKIRQRVR
ncbi:MAG: tRNA guanosine(15) transglycosylase TgtA, partial [Candidatus Thermoplasmatota archaeon]|nr:tRNA guanosine(15) transglycosylase TgtA [Candidatus Thermoplasmatota archaeon]